MAYLFFNHTLMTILKVIAFLGAFLILLYALGPRPSKPVLDTTLPQVPSDLALLEQLILQSERSNPGIKPDNEARIIWYDSTHTKTEYCLVYLPGFTATYMEGMPVHQDFARRYGCNLYLPRLYDHGLEGDDVYAAFSPDSLLDSATRALAVGQQLGEKAILMSCSTGGTLSILLAAGHPELAGLITYSPNIEIKNSSARLRTYPWGLYLGRVIVGSKYREYEAADEFKKYWYTRYRLEGLVGLQTLLDAGMTPQTFRKVQQPFFMGYYYKNETEQDEVVSVPAMLKMFEQLGTPENLKQKKAFPNVGQHAMISRITSQDIPSVEAETFRFAEEVLGLRPPQGTGGRPK